MELNEKEQKTILVVDDEEVIRDTLRIHLEKEGYRVVTSKNGKDAIEALEEDEVSLVITDIKMPKLDGFGVLEHTRKHYSYVPVVMLTGYIDVNLAVDAMRMGSFHYLTKPVRKKELIATVEDALKKTDTERELESFRVSQLYILAEGGLVIYHKDVNSVSKFDSDIFGSMLTAVRMFIDHSFDSNENDDKMFEYGNSKILIEEGEEFFLVVIGEGRDIMLIKERMKKTVKRVERNYGDEIASWRGGTEVFADIENELHELLEMENLGGESDQNLVPQEDP
ncbi:MAG: response regulator [Thermoplasmata archaeon]|nr:response regulator [Thermoplasmata archaeon]